MKMKTTISVSIDLNDEFEKALLKHTVDKGNKSRYIKRLIHADMLGIQTIRETPVTVHDDDDDDEDKKAVGSFF